jgi:rhodanese-related sulfurtransferase
MYFSYLSLFFLIIFSTYVQAISLEDKGVEVKYMDQGKEKTILVKRHIAEECKKLPINNEMVWTGNYANSKVPEMCKSTYAHTTGKLLAMFIHADVQTYGELEVLITLRQMQKDKSILLVDARKASWFKYRTIPGSVNIPFNYVKNHKEFEFEFEDIMKILDIRKYARRPLDFRYVKDIVVYCNGPWCSQSIMMIQALIALGYPPEKISWYRGGMQTWLAAGMTSTRD